MPPTDTTDPPRELRPPPSRSEIDPLAREMVRRHGEEVMASARHWAETPEDAEDAFQRGLEIMLTKAPTTDPQHLLPWLKTVVKREAWSIRRQRERHTPPASDVGELDSPGPATAHEQAVRFEQLQLGAEALGRLRPHEVRAFVLKAEGLSYQEICEETGWTYTKVNRLLTEGRRRFHDRLAGIESGAECARLAPLLSALADGEARAEDMTLLRPHLRTCLMCRARLRDYRAAPAKVAALAPPVAAGSLLASLRETFHAASGWLSERSAALAIRWQQAAELATAHKGAAVLASAAVLGGGGAATVASVEQRAPARTASAPTRPAGPPLSPALPAEHRQRAAPRRPALSRRVPKAMPSSGGSHSRPSPSQSPSSEFSPAPSATPADPKPTPARAATEPAPGTADPPGGGGEFSP
jgi:RNA polymerase sigma factor (sigma-70 family)